MPFTVGSAVVPVRPAGLVVLEIKSEIVPLDVVIVLPKTSCSATEKSGSTVFAIAVTGCTTKPSRVAGPGVMSKAVLVTASSPSAEAISV
jgi:hypothetical protein